MTLFIIASGCVTNDSGKTTVVPPKDTGQSPAHDTLTAPHEVNAATDTASPDIPQPPKDDRLANACGANMNEGIVGEAYLGAPCEEHSDCETGFCYDGKFMGWEGGFKFCTASCGGCPSGISFACADFNVNDGPRYSCIRLPSCHEDEHPVREFCVPSCQGSNGMGNCNEWFGEGTYLECMTPSTEDCGGIGASKACFVPEP